jgi:hypothetical protein
MQRSLQPLCATLLPRLRVWLVPALTADTEVLACQFWLRSVAVRDPALWLGSSWLLQRVWNECQCEDALSGCCQCLC